MKKVLTILLCVCVLLGFQGCTGFGADTSEQGANTESGDKNNAKSDEKPDLSGSVVSIKNNVITIVPSKETANGVTVIPKNNNKAASSTARKVKISDSTEIQIGTSADREKFSYSKGGISDIKEDSSIMLWGKNDGKEFIAKKIIVIKVDLNGDAFHLKGCVVTINDDTVTISKTFIDSQGNMCDMDGCSRVRSFFKITLPLLSYTIFFVFIIAVINSLRVYREAYLIFGQYPSSNIYMLQHFMNNNFSNLNYQILSTASVLVFIFVAMVLGLLFKLQKKYEV